MGRRRQTDDGEVNLWDSFATDLGNVVDPESSKQPGPAESETAPEPEVEAGVDVAPEMDDVAALEGRIEKLTEGELKTVEAAIAARIEAIRNPPKPKEVEEVDSTPDDQAIPKGITDEWERKLYLHVPYYGWGTHEVAIYQSLTGLKHPTIEEYDKINSTLMRWAEKDWCILSYTGGAQCPTFVWSEGKDAPKRYGLQWRRLNRKFWKAK